MEVIQIIQFYEPKKKTGLYELVFLVKISCQVNWVV